MSEIVATVVGSVIALVSSALTTYWSNRPTIEVKYVEKDLLIVNTGSRSAKNLRILDDLEETIETIDVLLPGETVNVKNTFSKVYTLNWRDSILYGSKVSKNESESMTLAAILKLLTFSDGFIPSESISLKDLPFEMSKLARLDWGTNLRISLKKLSSSSSMMKVSNKEFLPYPVTITVRTNLSNLKRLVLKAINIEEHADKNVFDVNANLSSHYFARGRWVRLVREIKDSKIYGLNSLQLFEKLLSIENHVNLDYSQSSVGGEIGTTSREWNFNAKSYSLPIGSTHAKMIEDSYGIVLYRIEEDLSSFIVGDGNIEGYISVFLDNGNVAHLVKDYPKPNLLITTKLDDKELGQIKREIDYYYQITQLEVLKEVKNLNFQKKKSQAKKRMRK